MVFIDLLFCMILGGMSACLLALTGIHQCYKRVKERCFEIKIDPNSSLETPL